MYHGTAFLIAVLCLVQGMGVSLGRKFSASRFWDDVRDSESTAFVYVGEAARYLLANPPSEKDRQHKVHLMYGNGMRPDVWQRFTARFGIKTVAEFFNSSEGMLGMINVCRGESRVPLISRRKIRPALKPRLLTLSTITF
jgi:acyl-CoA synthetase (AMP-forming)/AMP-acid ligase II